MTLPTPAQEKLSNDAGFKANSGDSLSDDSFAYENPMGINERALVRKLDWKLLPPLTLLYLLSFLDRSNSEFSIPVLMLVICDCG